MSETGAENPRTRLLGGLRLPPWFRLVAPPAFIVIVLLRSYLEMAVFSRANRFSYYTALHHLCWYASAMLLILLAAHLVLRVEVRRLVPMMLGTVVVAVPLVYAWIRGLPLNLTYLHGDAHAVLLQILTFGASSPRNVPLIPELVIIDVGMAVIGRLVGGTWRRGLLLALATHLSLAFVGLTWFGLDRGTGAILNVASRVARPQALQAAGWIVVVTVLVFVLLWRDGRFHGGLRSWLIALFAGADVWLVWMVVMLVAGWLRTPFDLVTTGVMPATLTVVIVRSIRRDRRLVKPAVWAVLALVIVVQSAVLAPVIAHRDHLLYRPLRYRIQRPRAVGVSSVVAAPPLGIVFSRWR